LGLDYLKLKIEFKLPFYMIIKMPRYFYDTEEAKDRILEIKEDNKILPVKNVKPIQDSKKQESKISKTN
jgi:hypothetical protein